MPILLVLRTPDRSVWVSAAFRPDLSSSPNSEESCSSPITCQERAAARSEWSVSCGSTGALREGARAHARAITHHGYGGFGGGAHFTMSGSRSFHKGVRLKGLVQRKVTAAKTRQGNARHAKAEGRGGKS